MVKEPQYFLRTLGELSLCRESPHSEPLATGTKPLLLLALLLDEKARSASRERLSQLLWPSSSKAKASLRTAIHSLHRLAPGLLAVDDVSVGLLFNRLDSDLLRFRTAVTYRFSREVVALASGVFLDGMESKAGWEVGQWIEGVNREVDAAVGAAYQEVIEECIGAGAFREAVAHAHAQYDRNPLRESAAAALVDALAVAGDHLGALQTFEKFEHLLRSELGEVPSPEFRRRANDLRGESNGHPVWVDAIAPVLTTLDTPAPAPPKSTTAGSWHFAAALVAMGLVAGSVGYVIAAKTTPTLAIAASGNFDAHLTGLIETDTGRAWADLNLERGTWSFSPRTFAHDWQIISPNGDLLATQMGDNNSPGLRVATHPDGEEVFTVDGESGNTPVGWSPDGRWLLYTQSARTGTTAIWRLMVVASDGSGERLLWEWEGSGLDASWSPRGDRIALRGTGRDGDGTILILDTAGDVEASYELDQPVSAAVAWDPLGTRIAVTLGLDPQVLHVTDAGDSDLRPEPLPFSVRTPVWIGTHRLAFVRRDTGASTLWTYDLGTGTLSQVPVEAAVDHLHAQTSWNLQGLWPDTILVEGIPNRLSPGSYFRPQARTITPRGLSAILSNDLPLFSVDGPARPASDEGWWITEGTGSLSIKAAIPGWRETSVQAQSTSNGVQSAEVLFYEDWSGGLDTRRWISFGDPTPSVDPVGGPQGIGALIVNGDDRYASGVVSLEPFDLREGLTVEVPVSIANESSAALEGFTVGLIQGPLPPRDSVVSAWLTPSRIGLSGPQESFGLACFPGCEVPPRGFPPPADISAWNRYGVQISRTGVISIVINGTVLWYGEIPESAPIDLDEPFHVTVDGQSSSGTTSVGPVTLYRGVKWGPGTGI